MFGNLAFFDEYMYTRVEQLRREADNDRLADQVVRSGSSMRTRIAIWLVALAARVSDHPLGGVAPAEA